MTRKTYIELYNALKQLSNRTGSSKFAYAVNKNVKNLHSLYEAFSDISKPPKEYFQFDKKREEICLKYVERKNGESVVENNNYKITENSKEDFEKEMDGLKSKFPDLKAATDKHQEEIMAWLDQEADETIRLHTIKVNECPDMSPQLMGAIEIIIEEDSVISQPGKMFNFPRK
jgi:hypothetical protein